MPVAALQSAQSELDHRVAVLLMGVAFSFVVRQQMVQQEEFGPATRMRQIRGLLQRIPALLRSLTQQRRGLSLELGTLLRKGPERYLAAALRELQGLAR